MDSWVGRGDLEFAIHFGDILDGYQPKDQSDEALSAVLNEFERLGRPTYHLIGELLHGNGYHLGWSGSQGGSPFHNDPSALLRAVYLCALSCGCR